ncbi:dehydrogenase/reductase SDR family member 7 [Vespula squamosa]|uniref:Dehydrogenase/reductase SDR family member 7 n=1 Tax=Vespula squamosa TaxID=30214 RepID=A0ABD2AFH7_VESSQ
MDPFAFVEFIVICYIFLHLIYLWSSDYNMELPFLTKFGKPIKHENNRVLITLLVIHQSEVANTTNDIK